MEVSIFWHRRDLRLSDNAGLFKALKGSEPVQPLFIFDKTILEKLPKKDSRVQFIYDYVKELKEEYKRLGADLWVYFGSPKDVFREILTLEKVSTVYTNRDYEPYALERDKAIYELLKEQGVAFVGAKDHVIFEKDEVLKEDGLPYTVFTPYSRKWKSKLNPFYIKSYPVEKHLNNLYAGGKKTEIPELSELGFEENPTVEFPANRVEDAILEKYHETRDIPSVKGTSRLSVHLRFGTISIRKLVAQAKAISESFLNELIWRDFYQMILFHFPQTVSEAFKPRYDRIEWENDEKLFAAWCAGKTGYPLVDAGMRELNETGYMHNRVRMVTASFLTKHLLIDWRWGERYFAEKLLDFDLAANVGGWQWAASCGCDAAPYFRVFNPTLQLEKFDPDRIYVRKWVKEFGSHTYPKPIVEHKVARERAIERYKQALNN